MPESSATTTTARRHHRSVYDATIELEAALAVPPGDLAGWLAGVERSLGRVAQALAEQRAEYTGPEGIFARVLEQAPRLQHEVERVRAEQDRIAAEVVEALAAVRHSAGDDTTIVGRVRDECLDIFKTVSRFRHDSSDLLHGAYEVDIGAGD